MNSKHTPGPWEVKKTVINPGAILERTATSITTDGMVICNVFDVPTETCMSANENASLIASAPLMEAVLEQIIEICVEHQKNIHGHPLFNAQDIVRLAEKALSKTELLEAA